MNRPFIVFTGRICMVVATMLSLTALASAQKPNDKPKAPAAEAKGEGDPLDATSAPEALAAYADAANLQNNSEFASAADEWKKFIEKHPKDPLRPKVQLYLGVCHMQLKKPEEAEKAFQTVVDKYPKFDLRDDALLNLGGCQYALAQAGKAEKYAAAAGTFGSLVKEYPTGRYTDQGLYFQGEALYRSEKKPEAIAAYAELVEKFPQSKYRADGLYALGVTREESNQFADAGKAYDLFLKEFEKHEYISEVRMRKAETILRAGLEAETGGKGDDAKKLFAQAETMFAEAAKEKDFRAADHALMRQAFAAVKQNKLDEAAGLYAQLTTAYPKSAYAAEAAASAGRTYYRADKLKEAATWLEKSLAAGGPDAPEAAHWLCRLYLKNKEPAKAAELAAKTLPTAGPSPFALNLKMDQADALYETPEKRGEALKVYEAIATENPKHEIAPQALYNAAFTAQELKQYDAAIASATKFLKEYKDDALVPDVRYVAAESQLLQGKHADAEKSFRELVAASGQHPEAEQWQLRLALALNLQKKYKETAEAIAKAIPNIKTPERLAEANFLLGAAQFYQDQFPEAAKSLEASLAASAKWRQADETLLLLARVQRKLNKVDEAIATAKKMLAEFPQSKQADQAHYRLGELAFAKDDFKTAAAEYDAVTTQSPDSAFAPFAAYGKGWSQLRSKEFAEATKSFTAFLEKNPKHELAAEAQFARAMSRRQAGELKEASADIDEFLKSGNPDAQQKADALYEKGLVDVALKNYDGAIKTFESILKENEKYAAADKVLYEMGWALKSQDKNGESLPHFEKLATTYPDSPLAAEALYHVGEAQYEKKEYEPAVKSYAAAQQKAGKSPLGEKSTYKLAWAHYQLQQFEPALKQFSTQAQDYPEGPLAGDALFMKAECLFKQQNYKDAYPAFQAAQKVKASSPNIEVLALLHGAQSAGQLNKWDEALKLAEQILKNHPDTAYLAETYYEQGLAHQNTKQLDAALKDYEEAATRSRGEVGARARFMLAEAYFGKKDFEAASKEYVRVMFGYGGDAAPEDVKKWQGLAGFQAGMCAEVQVPQAADADARAQAIATAKKHYTWVTEKHPKSAKAGDAKNRLETLSRL